MAATRPNAKQEQIVPAPLIGRDEMNLAEFPIALVADRVPAGHKTIYFEDRNGRLTVTGSDAYGLPTAADADVIVALVYLTKLKNNFRDVKVNFSRYEIIKLLNWRDESDSYRRLEQSFRRWSGVLLVYDKCWWNNNLKCYTDAMMHIIDTVEIINSEARRKAHRAGQSELPLSYFTWNSKFIESCQADNLRQLDLDEYFSLKSAVAKRLYRFLGKRFYLQRDWTFDLNEIAFDRIGLSRNYADAYKIKEKLQPAIDELEAIGFLRPLSRDDRYSRIDRGQWTIRLTRQSPTLVAPQQSAVPQAEAEPPPLVAALVQRGVTGATAGALVRDYPERIERQLEYFDWQTEQRPEKIGEPGGYLRDAIKKDYAAPKGFTRRADRERQAESARQRQQAGAEARRREKEQQERERAERQAITAYWQSLTAEQQAELDAASLATADPETLAMETGPLERMGRQIRRDQLIRHLLNSRESVPAEG